MHYVSSLSIKRAITLIKKAQHEEKIEKTYRWWLARYPLYTKDTYESFEEFYEKLYPPTVAYDLRSKDELMSELLGKEG